MTKSRSARLSLLAFAAWSFGSLSAAAPVAAAAIIAAPADPLGDVARRAALAGGEDCERGGAANDVVVCGRRPLVGGGYRVPYEPEPGARVRLVAGEAPSAAAALGAGGCLRLCYQPVMMNVFGAVSALAHGIDRLLHPD